VSECGKAEVEVRIVSDDLPDFLGYGGGELERWCIWTDVGGQLQERGTTRIACRIQLVPKTRDGFTPP
jgi:hypothetical protein